MEENEDEYDYEYAFTRLLGSVYQPFVDLAPGVLMEAERLLFNIYDGYLPTFVDNFLKPTTDLLCRLQTLTKTSTSKSGRNKSMPIGWPLCTYNRIIVHLGELLVVDTGHSAAGLETGDFYVSVIPAENDHNNKNIHNRPVDGLLFEEINTSFSSTRPIERRILLTLFYYDNSISKFRRIGKTLTRNDLVKLFTSLTTGDLTSELSIFSDQSIKLHRYVARKSNGDVDFLTMPLTFTARNNNEDNKNNAPSNNRANDEMNNITPTLSYVQNDEYFSFRKNGNETIIEEEESVVNNKNEIAQRSSTLLLLLSKENVAFSSNTKQFIDAGDCGVQNFAGRCPRKIADLTRAHLLLAGSMRYTGTVLWEECQTCLVEISLSEHHHHHHHHHHQQCASNVVIDGSDFARTLVYLNYVHRSSSNVVIEETCNKSSSLLLLIDCRQKIDSEIAKKFFESLDILKTLRSNIACRIVLVEADDSVKGMFQESLSCSELESYNIDELCSKLPISDISEEFGGERKYDGMAWIQFRKDLESFMDSCRLAAKFYISAIQRLRKFNEDNSPLILWSFSLEELDNRLEKLKNDLHYTTEASTALESFFVSGTAELEKLNEFVKNNDSVPHYREAVCKVSAFFDEVTRVMVKFQQGSERFSSMLEEVSKAKRILTEADSTILWLTDEVIPCLDKFRSKVNGMKNAKFLHTEFLSYKTSRVESILQRITDVQLKLTNLNTNLRHVTLLQRDDIESRATRLNELFQEYDGILESCGHNLSSTLLCYQLLDEAYEWALDSTKLSTNLGKLLSTYKETVDEKESLLNMREKLIDYSNKNPKEKLEKMRSIARQLNDERLAIQCQAADIRCNDTDKLLTNLKKRIEEVLNVNIDNDDSHNNTAGQSADQCPSVSGHLENSSASRSSSISVESSNVVVMNSRFGFNKNYRRSFAGSCSTSSLQNVCADNRRNSECRYSIKSQKSCSTGLVFIDKTEEENVTLPGTDVITEDLTDQIVSSISTTMLRKKIAERRACSNHQSLMDRSKKLTHTIFSDSPMTSVGGSADKLLRRPFRKFIRRASVMDAHGLDEQSKSRHPSLDSLSSVGDESYQSSSISAKSLPVSPLDDTPSCATADDTAPPYPAPLLPPEADDKLRVSTPPPGCSPTLRMQYNVVNELLQTELAYVRSLQYVIENYIPEMQRTDLPHVLRGQRRVIFGNIEKIHEFHVGHFLPDLTRFCLNWTESLGLYVAKCFLRHRQKFHLYALYNKNKPNSDALISECAGVFFRTKQLLLGDKLDLWSYLLKPVQRISKYSLFIQKLLKACPSEDLEQIEILKSVEDMLMSQLQHGNDLLAMDSIRNCDLNLKEHGKLLRQEEFVVFEGRHNRKCIRRIFLFENLVLFAKPRKIRSSNNGGSGSTTGEVYHYKNSIKMNDLGLTENVTDSELKFELWFRRHTSEEIYVVLAPSMAVKMAWITRVSNLLWQQAYLNRDLRNSEMTSMGIGSKICVDLNSEDRIQDRAVDNRLLTKGDRSRNALPSNLDVDRYNLTTKRPHSLISVGSSSSSSNNSSMCSSGLHSLSATTPMSFESGIFVDLSTLEEYPDDPTTTTTTTTTTMTTTTTTTTTATADGNVDHLCSEKLVENSTSVVA